MSNLRLFGLIIGIIGLIFAFGKYRGPKWRRSNFVFFSLLSLFIIIVSIDPHTVDFIRDLLSLKKYLYGRLLALLIVSNIFLLFYTTYTKSKQEALWIQFDKLLRHFGMMNLEKSSELAAGLSPITILIPAYNEAASLEYLLLKIPEKIKDIPISVLVIDDGSKDETPEIVRRNGRFVVSNPFNRGGGAALRLGYDFLRQTGGHICVTMDADGQHQPEEIEKLILPIIEDKYDFVIGSRVLGDREKDNLLRIAGVYLFGYIISLMIGQRITDPSSNFRAFRIDSMRSIRLYENQYHTSELIIEAAKKGMRIGEVPITILKRKYGKSKKGRNWIYGLNFAKTMLKTWWR